MSQAKPVSPRELRKRLLRLEAESHRLEMLASVRELRNPMLPLQHAPMLLGLVGNKSVLLASAARFIGGRHAHWIIKGLPLALAAWRIAKLVQRLVEKRRAGRTPDY